MKIKYLYGTNNDTNLHCRIVEPELFYRTRFKQFGTESTKTNNPARRGAQQCEREKKIDKRNRKPQKLNKVIASVLA